MKLHFTLLILTLSAANYSFAQISFSKRSNADTLHFKKLQNPHDLLLQGAQQYVYRTSVSNGVLIQSSLPKGGSYTDPYGTEFGYRVFWYRFVNEGEHPLELTISFSADSDSAPGSYLKLFLPPDTMSLDKVSLYSYGARDVKSFLDSNLHQSTRLQRTINPKEEYLFYIVALAPKMYGAARAELVLKEHDLFYSIKGITPELDDVLIPCGRWQN